MKAKEYAQQYRDYVDKGNPFDEALRMMFTNFVQEFACMCIERGSKTVYGGDGVYREFDQKWRCIARLLDFNEDGFASWIEQCHPDIHHVHVVATQHMRKG